jgi:hypothetical protein
MLRGLKTLTFVYVPREDRVVAAINAGQADAWSCWLTRRLALAVLEQTTQYLQNKSDLTQRAPANLRTEMIAFERDAAIATTDDAARDSQTERNRGRACRPLDHHAGRRRLSARTARAEWRRGWRGVQAG